MLRFLVCLSEIILLKLLNAGDYGDAAGQFGEGLWGRSEAGWTDRKTRIRTQDVRRRVEVDETHLSDDETVAKMGHPDYFRDSTSEGLLDDLAGTFYDLAGSFCCADGDVFAGRGSAFSDGSGGVDGMQRSQVGGAFACTLNKRRCLYARPMGL
jgi:hypothetical protein